MSQSEWKQRQTKPRPDKAYVEKCFQYAICDACKERIAMGELAVWFERKTWHLTCGRHLLGPVQESLL